MKKKVYGLLMLVTMLVLSLFVAVGCGETQDPVDPNPPAEKTEYTVTFQNGDSTVKSVTVEEGKELAATDIPAAPENEGYYFDGWFVGETEVAAGYKPTANVTAAAKFTLGAVVTFKNGDDPVKTVTVYPGTAIAEADYPADPEKAGYYFDGWFVGETEVNADYKPTEAVTATAKFTLGAVVTFKNGNDPVKTVTVYPGTTIAEADYPDDPTKPNFEFDGWYNGDDAVDLTTDTFSVATELVAKFNRIAYNASFVNGTTVETVTVGISNDGFILQASQIPAAPEGEEGEVFLGWYNGETKVVGGESLEADATYEALFVSADDYTGVWFNDDAVLTFNGGKVTFGSKSGDVVFNDQTGTATASTTTYYYDNLIMSIVGNKMTLVNKYYDTSTEEDVEKTYNLVKAEPVDYAGEYRNGNTWLKVTDGGIVTEYNGSVAYARMVPDGNAYKITYKNYSYSTAETVTAAFDAKGNLVIADASMKSYNGLFVKGVTEYSSASYYDSSTYTSMYLYFYTVGTEKVTVYNDGNGNYSYVTLSGDFTVGAKLTFTVGSETYLIKAVEEDKFTFAAAEAGTYTNGTDTLVLDGFGKATVNGSATELDYHMVGNIAVVGELATAQGYVLSGTSYSMAPRDTYYGTYKRYGNETKYYFVLDGFGGIQDYYVGSYSTSVYYNTYTVSGNTLTVTKVGSGYNVKGALAMEESGNVILYNPYGTEYVYVKDGYQLTDQTESFNGSNDGSWKDASGLYVLINTTAGTINYRGTVVTYQKNYNGSALTFEAVDEESAYPTVKVTYTAKIVEGSLVITHDRTTGYDATYEEYITTAIAETFESAPAPAVELDGFEGVYVGTNSYNSVITYVVDGNGTVTVNGIACIYTKESDTKISFTYGGEDYSLNGNPAEGALTVNWMYDYTDMDPYTAINYAGTWKGTSDWTALSGEVTVVLNVDYTATVNGNSATWSYASGKAEVVYGDVTLYFTANSGTEMSVVIWHDYMEADTFTATREAKQAEEALDAFAGTWTGKVGLNDYTVICDGKGAININGTDYTYTAGSESISVGVFTVTLNSDGTMHVVYDDGDYNAEGNLTKQA